MKKKLNIPLIINVLIVVLVLVMLITSVTCISYMNATRRELAELQGTVEQLKASVPLEEVERLEHLAARIETLK